MFDVNATFKLDNFPLAAGKSHIELRWPSDEEWEKRVRGKRILIRHLGRGRSEFESEPNPRVDLEIFSAISVNGTPEVTPSEATMLLDQLATCEVQGVELEGEKLKVEMRVQGGMVTHLVDLPTADLILKFKRKQARTIQLPHNQTESRQNLQASTELWGLCHGEARDQQGPASALHKDVAVRQAIDFVEQLAQPQDDDSF